LSFYPVILSKFPPTVAALEHFNIALSILSNASFINTFHSKNANKAHYLTFARSIATMYG